MSGSCPPWSWGQSRCSYCCSNPSCCIGEKSCSCGGGTSGGTRWAAREANLRSTALAGDAFAGVAAPILREPTIEVLLPQIMQGDALLIMEAYADDLFGLGYSADQFNYLKLLEQFSTLRVMVRQVVKDTQGASDNDRAQKLIDLFLGATQIQLTPVQALDLARIGSGDAGIALAHARTLETEPLSNDSTIQESQLFLFDSAFQHVAALADTNNAEERQLVKVSLEHRAKIMGALSSLVSNDPDRAIEAEDLKRAAVRLSIYASQL